MNRKRWALTQQELTELFGFQHRSHLSRLERGKHKPSALTLLAAEMVFGEGAHQLFPEAFAEMQDRIARNLRSFDERLKRAPSSAGNRRKQQLVTEALARVSGTPSQHTEHGR